MWQNEAHKMRCASAARATNLGRRKAERCPIIHPSLGDIRQAAGFYEGEGSSQPASKQRGSVLVQAGQKNRWPLDWMRDRFGGKVSLSIKGRKSPLHVWVLSGSRARGFLMTIYSFLSPRRQEQIRQSFGK